MNVLERQQIVLIRHGRPAGANAAPISGREVGRWVTHYNGLGIDRRCPPPLALSRLVASAGFVTASHLRRARESAEWLRLPAPLHVDSQLREAVLPNSLPSSLRMHPGAWVVLARIGWWLNWCASEEPVDPTRRRAARMANQMNRRVGAVVGIAILLVASLPAVGAQTSTSLALVDVPIPVYPPIAASARISGDVHVIVEVRPDGTVASATVASGEGFNRESDAKLLEQPVLEAARKARFRCEQCGDTSTPYSLVFAFRFADRVGRAVGDLHPEVVSISPSQTRILIVTELGLVDGPQSPLARPPRAARCLWLWHCRKYTEPDLGDPEVVPDDVVVPAYPAVARADWASGDIEVNVAVRRDGKVASAEIGTTRNLVGSTQAIASAFQRAAVQAARQTTFFCRRCRRGTLPDTLVYAFRFDGVLELLDLGYAASGFTFSPAQARVLVSADVPILDAALGMRADTLPAGCRLAPARPAVADLPVSGNPWTGDDTHLISLLRGRIVGRLGSDPPSRYELQLAEGVGQAYVAWYVDGNRETTAVYGLLFGDSNDARAFVELARRTGSTTFLVHRQIVVAVRGANTCVDALARLLKDHAKP